MACVYAISDGDTGNGGDSADESGDEMAAKAAAYMRAVEVSEK